MKNPTRIIVASKTKMEARPEIKNRNRFNLISVATTVLISFPLGATSSLAAVLNCPSDTQTSGDITSAVNPVISITGDYTAGTGCDTFSNGNVVTSTTPFNATAVKLTQDAYAGILQNFSGGTFSSIGTGGSAIFLVRIGSSFAKLDSLINFGTISSTGSGAVSIRNNGYIDSITNFAGGIITSSNIAIGNNGIASVSGTGIGTILNSGTISAGTYAIENATSRIENIVNAGQIFSTGIFSAIINLNFGGVDPTKGYIGQIQNRATGTISSNSAQGTIQNQYVIGQIINNGTISNSNATGAVISNTGDGFVGLLTNTGSILASSSSVAAINFGSFATGSSILNNSGIISGGLTSGTMGSLSVNQTAGSITGAINLAAATSVINMSGGTITGNINLSGSTANIMNLFAGNILGNINFNGAAVNELNIRTGEPLIFGNITNTIPNTLTMNVDGAFLTRGNIGTGAAPIRELNINANGDFIQQAANSVYAATTNINYDGVYTPFGPSVTLNSNLFVNEGGMIAVLDSGWQANINGSLNMAAGSAAFIPIGLATATDYGKIVSNQPLNIASGAFIVATLDPTQNPALGTVLHGVIQGAGAPIQAGEMIVLNSSSRYQFQAQWHGNEVDLVLPNRRTSDYTAVFGAGGGQSVELKGSLANYSGYSPGNGGVGGAGGIYDGALARQTIQSISAVQGPTQGLMHQRYAVLNAAMEYDCKTFDKNGFCLSVQARATGFGSQATGAGVFNIAFRPVDQLRIGAFLDYQVTAGNPVMNGIYGGGYLSSGSVVAGYDNPTFGGYVGFSQSGYSGRVLNTGVQAFLSGGYNPGKISVTRAMALDLYDASFVDSQPGSGTASLNSYFYRGLVGYGLAITDNVTFMPYGGLRITDVTRGGYMEGYNIVVQQPLIFNSFGEHLFTGFGGGMLNCQINEKLGALLGLGAEADISRSADNFSGYAPIQIERMRTFGLRNTAAYNGVRPTGSVGAYFDLTKNQRLMINGYAGQQAWSSRGFATGMLGYQVAF